MIGTELPELFAEAVCLVSRVLGVEYCNVLELLPDGEALITKASVGWKNECTPEQLQVRVTKQSQAGFTLSVNEPVVVDDLRTETRFSDTTLLDQDGVVSGMSIIIRGLERPYGVLGAYTTLLRKFQTDDVDFLRAVANVLAEAMARKHAEDELRTSEARFRRVVESNVFGIFFSDPDGKISVANDAFLSMVGYDRSDLIAGRVDWSAMSPPEYAAIDEKAILQITTMGVCDTYEKEFIRKDGTRISVLISVATFGGSAEGGVAFVLDISDRKRAEESLKQSETWLDAIFAASRDGIVVEENDHIVYTNQALASIYGYGSPEEIIGKHVSHFRAVDEDQRLLDFTRQRLAGENAPPMYEFKGLRKDSESVLRGSLRLDVSKRGKTIRRFAGP